MSCIFFHPILRKSSSSSTMFLNQMITKRLYLRKLNPLLPQCWTATMPAYDWARK
ncbi:hypothetical protein LINGRAHAP2_LOCUS15449 [Linum grandiflorum]